MVTLASRNIPLNCADFLRSELGPWAGEPPVPARPGEAQQFVPGACTGLCPRAVYPGLPPVALGPAGTGRLPLSPELTVLFSSSNTLLKNFFFFLVSRWVCFHTHCFS